MAVAEGSTASGCSSAKAPRLDHFGFMPLDFTDSSERGSMSPCAEPVSSEAAGPATDGSPSRSSRSASASAGARSEEPSAATGSAAGEAVLLDALAEGNSEGSTAPQGASSRTRSAGDSAPSPRSSRVHVLRSAPGREPFSAADRRTASALDFPSPVRSRAKRTVIPRDSMRSA